MVELYNDYYVMDFILSVTLELIAGKNPACQVQLRLLTDSSLQKVAFFWWPSEGVLQLVHWWEQTPCVQK